MNSTVHYRTFTQPHFLLLPTIVAPSTFYLAFHLRHLPDICLRRIPSRFCKGDDRRGSVYPIVPSVIPAGWKHKVSVHIMRADSLIHGRTFTSFSRRLVIFQCFVADEGDNMCLYRFLEKLYRVIASYLELDRTHAMKLLTQN